MGEGRLGGCWKGRTGRKRPPPQPAVTFTKVAGSLGHSGTRYSTFLCPPPHLYSSLVRTTLVPWLTVPRLGVLPIKRLLSFQCGCLVLNLNPTEAATLRYLTLAWRSGLLPSTQNWLLWPSGQGTMGNSRLQVHTKGPTTELRAVVLVAAHSTGCYEDSLGLQTSHFGQAQTYPEARW